MWRCAGPVGVVALAIAPAGHAADLAKVIRHAFPAAETGFDPAGSQELYSGTIEHGISETLLTYVCLTRPAKLVPLMAEIHAGKISSVEEIANIRKQRGADQPYYAQRGAFIIATTPQAQGRRGQ
jgi:hypothetical protein